MFLPYRTDLEFSRLPVVTIAVCVLCIFIFIRQTQSDSQVEASAARYCQQDHARMFWRTMQKLAGNQADAACPIILATIYSSANTDRVIQKLAEHAAPWDLKTAAGSRAYTAQQLHEAFDEFRQGVRPSLTSKLAYDPSSYNVWRMITAAFAHADWGHIIGNLIFFYAFATTVEVVIGSVSFALMILFLAIGTHTVYSISQNMAHNAIPTLGLSGVVMGVIGLFVYLLPTARIRCLLWLLIFWRVLRVPAWLLAAWYVGWNVYDMLHDDGSSHINFVVHVSGAVLGYMAGLLFFRDRKEWAQGQLR